jgi:hypothetical protein
MKLFFVCRVPCEHQGRLVETIGVCLTEAEAVAMCSMPADAIVEVETGRFYPPGEVLPDGVRTRFPHCAKNPDWQVSRGLAVVG